MAADLPKIISDISRKNFSPVYLLCGEEPYYVDVISDYIEESVLDEAEREFNQAILYGRDVDAGKVIEYAKRFPMMSQYQVVIVKEAQDMKTIDDLCTYVEKPLASTILVLCYKHKKYDKRKALAKLVEKKGIYYESGRMYQEKMPAWITDFVTSKGYKINPKAAVLLGDFLGTDLSKVANEIGKLFILFPKGSTITEEIIEKNIGISKDYNFFEFQEALASKNIEKANRIVNFFNSNPKENPLVKIVPMTYNFFSKVIICATLPDKSQSSIASALGIAPFMTRDYVKASGNYSFEKLNSVISILREFDLKSKGVDIGSIQGPDLMKEMVFRILH
ncbi:MAG TPA: DNA polymerase III subunit delta [Lentimicrobium sp.]|nr:DNA polymerase III subunit delta [Lentimicrobium sp.]